MMQSNHTTHQYLDDLYPTTATTETTTVAIAEQEIFSTTSIASAPLRLRMLSPLAKSVT
jgi:hypothetical protein